MLKVEENPTTKTIQKTLMMVKLFAGFWDRWIAHGLDRERMAEFRLQIDGLEKWGDILQKHALEFEHQALKFQDSDLPAEAEYLYRIASLHYNLLQWIYPRASVDKRKWFSCCKQLFDRADEISADLILDAVIQVHGQDCFGRIRVPKQPQGCIVIINPMDSSKEEWFSYESDFARMGFATVSFDGPGQGETFTRNQHRASARNWTCFVNQVIDFADVRFPDIPIYLFGTSSGGAWAIRASAHPKVHKVVAISPACESGVTLPEYFRERLSYTMEDTTDHLLPNLDNFEHCSPVLMFHGNRDVMVRDQAIYELYCKLPQGAQLIEYEDEGHCCNYKLPEIREIASLWLLEG